jgi:hypothetical protein
MRCCCPRHSSHRASSRSCSPPLYATTHAQPLVATSSMRVVPCTEPHAHGSSVYSLLCHTSSRSLPPPLCVLCRVLMLYAPLGSPCIQTLMPISYMHASSLTTDVLSPAQSLSSPHACYNYRLKKPFTNSWHYIFVVPFWYREFIILIMLHMFKVDIATCMLTDTIMKYHSRHNYHILLPHRIAQHLVENLPLVLRYCKTQAN